jgi:cytochrome oxidase assembly protein ShyY1
MPVPASIEVSINNNHAGYALFWFVMAIAMVVIYGLRFIAPQFRKKF